MNNLFILEGNLTKEPETKSFNNRTVLKFTIAETVRVKDANGNWVDGESNFYDMDFWTDNPQFWLQRLQKGTAVVVKGNLKQDKWEKDGQKHSKIGFTVTDINAKWLPTIEQQNAMKGNRTQSAPAQQSAAPSEPAMDDSSIGDIPF